MKKRSVLSVALTLTCALACSPSPVGGAGGTGSGGTSGSSTEENPFCSGSPSPEAVLQARCTTCHSDPPNSGAPFKLTTYADAKEHASAIAARVDAGTMPPDAEIDPLSAEQKAALLNWVNSEAPGGECTDGPGCPEDPNRCAGEEFLPCTPDVYFLAHSSDPESPAYKVPAGAADKYTCFQFANPFYETDTLITAEAPVTGNTDVTHHWLLFGSMQGEDGSFGPCSSPEFTDPLLSGWAPGGTNQVYPDDVGVLMNQYPFLTLQIHYNNPSSIDAPDTSGIAYCSTTEQRPNVAGAVTLGTDLGVYIPGNVANYPGGVSSCSNLYKDPRGGTATIIESVPHMHKLGAGFTTEHIRDGERIGYVSNVPRGTWRFEGQTHYAHSEVSPGGSRIVVEPGDVLKTTCYYTNPNPFAVGFGGKTRNEMCYDFMIVYPIDNLRRGCGPLITFLN